MENAIPAFLEYGAMGVLALAFIVLLYLFVRADRRAQEYANGLKEATFDRATLIQVVAENTKAFAALSAQIERMGKAQEKYNSVIERLAARLENDRCPLLKESAGPAASGD